MSPGEALGGIKGNEERGILGFIHVGKIIPAGFWQRPGLPQDILPPNEKKEIRVIKFLILLAEVNAFWSRGEDSKRFQCSHSIGKIGCNVLSVALPIGGA